MGALDNTFGAFLIGVVISATLYGVTCIQTWYYYGHYPSDLWHVKLLVAAAFISDTCHQALITHSAYTYLVTDFGSLQGLESIVWSLIVEVIFNGLTALFVQSFMAMRVYRLSNKNIILTGTVMALVSGEFALIIFYVSRALPFQTFVQLSTLKPISMAVNAVAAAGDVLIAGSLCFLLQKSRTGFRRSDTMINKLIIFSINTGLLTSICAVASLVSISAWPNTFIYIAFYFCLGRLYCNSLLATLNARKGLRSGSHSDEMSLSLQGVQKTNQSITASTSKVDFLEARSRKVSFSHKRAPNNISIKIDTTQEYARDEYSSSGDVKSPAV